MKNWKISLLTALSFFALTSLIAFSSCEQDPCLELDCKNGVCADGLCQCPTGFEGAECDIPASSRFVGAYAGTVRCDNFPYLADTISIELIEAPNKVRLKMGFGNTSLLSFTGTAETPETRFSTFINESVEVHAYVTVDGDLIYVFLETIDKTISNRQICRFTGRRIKPAQ